MEVNAEWSTDENTWMIKDKRDEHMGEPHEEEQRQGFQARNDCFSVSCC